MQENLKERINNLKAKLLEINNKYSKKTKILVAAILVVIIVFAFVVAAILNNKSYETLYTNLNEQEASEIIAKLQEDGVADFKYKDGVILVPEKQVDQLRATLTVEGYPKSGMNYDVFKSNIDLMSTDFEKREFKIFDLQERLASTIRLFEGVKSATVQIAVGEDKKYVKETDKVDSSAVVTVIMKEGGSPTEEQVKGIQRLVARSVPGMTLENVSVIDGEGREVSASGDVTQSSATELKLRLEREIEDSVKAKLLGLLSAMYGEDNVRVVVKCSADVDKKISEIINYTPSTDDNKGVIDREVTGQEVITDGGQVGGIPGTETNATIPQYPNITVDGNQIYYNNARDYDYLVNQMKQQIQSDAGTQTDLTIAIAVDNNDLTAQRRADLMDLVAKGAGIDPTIADQKIAIFNTEFYEEGEAPTTWNGLLDYIKNSKYGKFIVIGLVVLLLLLILIGVLLAKRKKKEIEEVLAEEEVLTEVEGEPLIDINSEDVKPTREKELRDQIREFSDQNPEIAAQLIKSWLRGGEEAGN